MYFTVLSIGYQYLQLSSCFNLLSLFFIPAAVESRLLQARIKMQQKYIDQFHMLYDDFNITKLPLLSEEVSNLLSHRISCSSLHCLQVLIDAFSRFVVFKLYKTFPSTSLHHTSLLLKGAPLRSSNRE